MKKKWQPQSGDLVACHFYNNKLPPWGIVQKSRKTPYGYYNLEILIDGKIINSNSYRCSLVEVNKKV